MVFPIGKPIQSGGVFYEAAVCFGFTQQISEAKAIAAIEVHANPTEKLVNVTVGMTMATGRKFTSTS